ncbi:hypothetical protein GCM10010442_38740 [Kitasatospora kifunensis]
MDGARPCTVGRRPHGVGAPIFSPRVVRADSKALTSGGARRVGRVGWPVGVAMRQTRTCEAQVAHQRGSRDGNMGAAPDVGGRPPVHAAERKVRYTDPGEADG